LLFDKLKSHFIIPIFVRQLVCRLYLRLTVQTSGDWQQETKTKIRFCERTERSKRGLKNTQNPKKQIFRQTGGQHIVRKTTFQLNKK
jgi:hypothetical protein